MFHPISVRVAEASPICMKEVPGVEGCTVSVYTRLRTAGAGGDLFSWSGRGNGYVARARWFSAKVVYKLQEGGSALSETEFASKFLYVADRLASNRAQKVFEVRWIGAGRGPATVGLDGRRRWGEFAVAVQSARSGLLGQERFGIHPEKWSWHVERRVILSRTNMEAHWVEQVLCISALEGQLSRLFTVVNEHRGDGIGCAEVEESEKTDETECGKAVLDSSDRDTVFDTILKESLLAYLDGRSA
jgi:hypothetical protein